MTPDRLTTILGMIAGAALAAAQAFPAGSKGAIACNIVGAAAVGALGWKAAGIIKKP